MTSQGRPRRRRRWIASVLGGLVIVVLLAIAMVPTFVSWGLGRSRIHAAAAGLVNGSIELGDLELGWFGAQRIDGLELADADGQPVADLHVTLHTGLLDAIIGGLDSVHVQVGGTLHVERSADGTLNLTELFAAAGRADELPWKVPMSLNVTGLDVHFHDSATGERLVLEGLEGRISYEPVGGTLALQLEAATERRGTPGAVTVTAELADVFDSAGRLTPGHVTGELRGEGIPTALLGQLLSAGPFVLARDLGPTIDLEAMLPVGATRRVQITATAEAMQLTLDGRVDPASRTLELDALHLAATVAPALLAGVGLHAEQPVNAQVELNALTLSGGDDVREMLHGLAAEGRVKVHGDVARPGTGLGWVTDLEFHFRTEGLAARLELDGQAVVDGTDVTFDVAVAGLLDELDGLNADVQATLVALHPDVLAGLAPAWAPYVRALTDQPISLTLDAGITGGEARITATVGDTSLEGVPGLAEPITFSAFEINASIPLDAPASATIEGDGQLQRSATGQHLAMVRFSGSAGGLRAMRVIDTDVAALDDLLGGPGLVEWLGDRGQVVVTLDRSGDEHVAEIDAAFPRFTGRVTARADGEVVSLTADRPTVTLGRLAVQDLIATTGGSLIVTRDMPMSVTVRSLRVPYGLLTGGMFDPDAVDIDVTLEGGPLEIRDERAGRTSMRSVSVQLRSDNLERGLNVRAHGQISMDGDEGGGLELNATVANLMHGRQLTPRRARLGGALSGKKLRTRVLDRIAGMDGLLVAALGAEVSVDAVADEFSRETGSLDLNLETSSGAALSAIVRAVDDGLALEEDRLANATLPVTEALRDRLLSRVHPLLADVQTASPLRATLRDAFVPLDGNVARARADLEIQIGRVDFDAGSVTLLALGILDLFDGRDPQSVGTIRGRFEDIKVHLENGILTYREFTVKIEEVSVSYRGTVNLNTNTLDLRTQVPISDSMRRQFKVFRKVPRGTMIPFRTHGALDNPVTEVDWDEVSRRDTTRAP